MPSRAGAWAWIAVLGLLPPTVSAAQDRGAREIVELIVRDGPQARAIRAETEVTRREQAARLAYPNPALSYSREGAGFTEFFQVSQELPVFGIRPALERAGVAATAAVEADRDARLWMLRADAEVAVARLLAEQSRLDAAQRYAGAVERLIEVLQIREREGEGSRFDRLRAEQERREAGLAVTAAAIGSADARAVLNAMLPPTAAVTSVAGLPPSSSVTVPGYETLRGRAVAARAELRALERATERADLEADAAHRARRPTPSVFGGLKRADTDAGREKGGVFGISAQVPLFDGGGRDAARWVAERERVAAERLAMEQQISAEITRAMEAVTLRQAALAADQPEGADELTRIAEVAYREGEVGILELLDAARAAARARTRNLDLRLDLRLAQVALERAVGETLWP